VDSIPAAGIVRSVDKNLGSQDPMNIIWRTSLITSVCSATINYFLINGCCKTI